MLVDAANDISSNASPEMDVSLPTLQPNFSPMNTTSASRFLIAPGVEDQNIRESFGPIERGASAKAAYSVSALQVAQQRAPSIPSSVGEIENHSSLATFQVASTPGFPSHIADQAFGTLRRYISLGASPSALAIGESYRQTIIYTDFEFFLSSYQQAQQDHPVSFSYSNPARIFSPGSVRILSSHNLTEYLSHPRCGEM